MKTTTIFKKDFSLGKFHVSILNYEYPKFSLVKLPKRIIVDVFWYQIWLSWI
jgi:hypothetical protein